MSKFATPSAELRAVLKRLRRQHIARVYSIESWPVWCAQDARSMADKLDDPDGVYEARRFSPLPEDGRPFIPARASALFEDAGCCPPIGYLPRCVGCPSTPGEERRMTPDPQDRP